MWNRRRRDFHESNYPGRRSTSTIPDQNTAAIPDTGWTLNRRHIRCGSAEALPRTFQLAVAGWGPAEQKQLHSLVCGRQERCGFGVYFCSNPPQNLPGRERTWTSLRLFSTGRYKSPSGGEATASNTQSVRTLRLFEEDFDARQSSTRTFRHTGGVFVCKCASACVGGGTCVLSQTTSLTSV